MKTVYYLTEEKCPLCDPDSSSHIIRICNAHQIELEDFSGDVEVELVKLYCEN